MTSAVTRKTSAATGKTSAVTRKTSAATGKTSAPVILIRIVFQRIRTVAGKTTFLRPQTRTGAALIRDAASRSRTATDQQRTVAKKTSSLVMLARTASDPPGIDPPFPAHLRDHTVKERGSSGALHSSLPQMFSRFHSPSQRHRRLRHRAR
jgi:hypothetical protein